MTRLDQLFQLFLRERTYLQNVTPKTRVWYESAWKAFTSSRRGTDAADSALLTRADLSRFVVHLRERGVRPVSCNTWLRALNAFCGWLHAQGEIPTAVKLAPQRLERRLIATHADAVLRAMVSFRPRTFCECRVHTLVVTILDTGCRIEELLTAPAADFDFDNLLLTVYGKGRKERRVPFSVELRKSLFRFQQRKERAGIKSDLMFPAQNGGNAAVSRRVCPRRQPSGPLSLRRRRRRLDPDRALDAGRANGYGAHGDRAHIVGDPWSDGPVRCDRPHVELDHADRHRSGCVAILQWGSVASVSGTGNVTAVATGEADIRATYSGANGSAHITVVPAAPSTPTTPNSFTLTGRVTEQGTGTVLSDVLIELKDRNVITSTNGAGNYTLTGIAPGNYTLRASKSGYTLTEPTFSISANRTLDFTIPKVASTPTPGPSTSVCAPRSATCGQATAVCDDGSLSCSQNRPGTCSSHGGVSCWICPGTLCNGLTAPAGSIEPLLAAMPELRK